MIYMLIMNLSKGIMESKTTTYDGIQTSRLSSLIISNLKLKDIVMNITPL